LFRLACDLSEGEIGADLQDQLDARVIDFAHGAAQSFGRFVRHQQWAIGFEPEQIDHFEATVSERAPDLGIAGRHIGRDERDAPDTAIALNRRLTRLRPENDSGARARFQMRLHTGRIERALPKCFRRHRHDHRGG
jgi:hypothetical protein